MSVGNVILLLAVVWCIIYVFHFLTNRNSSGLLPAHPDFRPTTRRPILRGHSYYAKTSLKPFQFKITLTTWNTPHDKLASLFVKHRKRAIGLFVRWFYNLGSAVGAFGMLAAFAAMLYTCGISGWTFFQNISYRLSSDDISDIQPLAKRSWDALSDALPPGEQGYDRFSSITPIIPGVTVPLSHLPIIIVSVFASQIIHELGHAISAAAESLPMLAAGASFIVCIPAAFVSFSSAGMKALSPQARSRVIAAGPFHNVIFWCFLALLDHSGVVDIVSVLSGYQSISHIGKAVIGVNLDSSLSLYLPPGAIITKLDDTSLTNASRDVWSDYLKGPTQDIFGWCVARTVLEKFDVCCTSSQSNMSAFACFVSLDNSEHGCIDPVPVLTKLNHGRCSSSDECPPESACVTPQKESQLIRLTVLPMGLHTDEATVVLWNGPSSEILEEVQVGNWLPRTRILPLWFPALLSTFWAYLTMATLSLYFFNLLPLPFLDGTELLESFLDWFLDVSRKAFAFDIIDLEVGGVLQEGMRTQQRRKEQIMKYVPYTTSGIMMLSILLAIINAMH